MIKQSYNSHMYGNQSHAVVHWRNLLCITQCKVIFPSQKAILVSKQPQLKGLTACVKFIWAFHRYRLSLNKPATKYYQNKCSSWSVALSKMSKTNVTKATFKNCQQLHCKTGSISTSFQNTKSFQVPLEHAYSRLETTTDAERKMKKRQNTCKHQRWLSVL